MSTTDLPGSSLLAGRYRLVERLGAGGMSVVWRGFDEVLGRQVAVKVLPPSTSADPSFRRRLRAEAQAAARLSHPNITNVYDYGEATTADGEAVPYVVMELVDGESLAAVLARVRRLPWPAAVRICAEVSAALAAAHARGIVHRDVTPANVMLTPTGAKVVDFGISALIGENDIDPDGSLLGTPAYLAPERLEGGQVSPATDVYAVGLLIYRTLIGQLPWDVGTTTALLRAHQYTEPDPLPPVEGLPNAVSALIGRCLEKRPDDRPSSAEMVHVLAGVAAESPVRGLVPDWAENGEDTTILPSAYPYTGGLGRPRAGYARAPEPPAAGRGVAAVRAAAEGPSGLAAAAAAMAAAEGGSPVEAPVSPAPGTAVPVPVADVEAAVAGRAVGTPVSAGGDLSLPSGPVAGTGLSAPGASPSPGAPSSGAAASFGAASAAADLTALPGGPNAPALPATPGDNRGPGPAPGRNNRFGAVPPPRAVAAPAPASESAVPAQAGPPASIRPAFAGPGEPPARRDGNMPPPPPPPAPTANGAPGGGRPGGQGRRVLIVAGAVALLGLATYGWSLAASTGGADAGKAPKALPEPSVVAATGKCVVSYAVWSDDGKRFKASVTVANRDNRPITDWKLWWIMQGDQTVSGNGKLRLDQQGTTVTVDAPGVLSPQKAVTMDVTGRYNQSNAAPMVFELDGKTCETYVSGKPGEPSRPVQKLTNGQTRLGPPVRRDTPLPGITVGPGGVVTPGPLPTGTNPGPTTTTTTGGEGPVTTTTPTPTNTTPSSVPPRGPDSTTPPTTPPTTETTPPDTTVTTPPVRDTETPDPADQDPADVDTP